MGFFHRQRDADAAAEDSQSRPAERRVWGFPGRCPRCGALGYLDRIDVVDLVMFTRCPDCDEQWSERQADLESQA